MNADFGNGWTHRKEFARTIGSDEINEALNIISHVKLANPWDIN